MNALIRLQHQVRDLTERYVTDDIDDRPLMTQLLYLGPHLRSSNEVVGKIQPRSAPPGNLNARDLYDRIMAEAVSWARDMAAMKIRESQALPLIPTLAGQLNSDDDRLHGASGLYSVAGHWHLSVLIALCYERRPNHYPLATCPHCHYRDHRGGSIRARETLSWCSNRDCRDEHGHRREFSILYLQDLLRAAAYAEDLKFTTAATGVPA